MVIPLQGVSPLIPSDENRKRELDKDLLRMGCGGLLAQPWDLKDEDMVEELLREQENQWEGTIRRALEVWTVEAWALTYSFPATKSSLAART